MFPSSLADFGNDVSICDTTVAPATTLAAQIVENHAKSRDIEKQQMFQSLLEEYLADTEKDEDLNIAKTADLLATVSRCGLDPLFECGTYNPFIQIQQAKSSIVFTQALIDRYPRIFFHVEDCGLDYPCAKPPVVVWLFIKLIRLISLDIYSELRELIEKLLVTCLCSPQKIPGFHRNANGFLNFLCDVVNGLLSSVERTFLRRDALNFIVTIPSETAQQSLRSGLGDAFVYPRTESYDIKSVDHAIRISICLINSISSSLMPVNLSSQPDISRVVWVLDWVERLLNPILLMSHSSSELNYFSTLQIELLSCAKSVFPFDKPCEATKLPLVCRFAYQIRNILCSVAKCPVLILQSFLAHCLLDLRIYSLKNPNCESVLLEILSPEADLLHCNTDLYITLFSRFSFSILLWTSSWSNSAHRKECVMSDDGIGSSQESGLDDEEWRSNLERLVQLLDNLPDSSMKIESTQSSNEIGKDWQVSLFHHLMESITSHLRISSFDSEENVRQAVSNLLSENEECILPILRKILICPCAYTKMLYNIDGRMDSFDVLPEAIECQICDNFTHDAVSKREELLQVPSESMKNIMQLVTFMIIDEKFSQLKPGRVLMAQSIRRILNHINDADFGNISSGLVGKWCLKCFQSSIRELRIACALTLPSFIRYRMPPETLHSNRVFLIDVLQALKDINDTRLLEGLIIFWGQIGRICGAEELNISLLQLVEFLGHPDEFIRDLTYTEIQFLGEYFGQSVEAMFKPYWQNIALTLVQSILEEPSMIQLLSELLGMSVNQLLLLTQSDTVPQLVLMKRKDVLERIALARGPGCSVYDLCISPSQNLTSTLALLFVQESQNMESSIMSILNDVAPEFEQRSLGDLVKIEPIGTTCELLKYLGENDCQIKKRALDSLTLLASLTLDKKLSKTKSDKNAKLVESFFELHVLGIMTYFSNILDSPKNIYSVMEMRRCLNAIKPMMHLINHKIGVAIPQIRACLQSAIKVRELTDTVISVWTSLMEIAEESDVKGLVNHLMTVIGQEWESFSGASQQGVYDLLNFLFEKYNDVIRSHAEALPSLDHITLLSKFAGGISRIREKVDNKQMLEAFTQRCSDDNVVVVEQGLRELIRYLETNQGWIHESVMGQQASPIVANLCRAILDASVKFTDQKLEICELCARCLGIIGCIDDHRIDAAREEREVVVVWNFEKRNEAIDFVSVLLETVLVKAFRSATNARAQNYLAFVMQELLKWCSFKESLELRYRGTQNSFTYRRWMQMPESVRMTLLPYFNSKFLLKNPAASESKQNYPIFGRDMSHGLWLRIFTKDLLHRGKGENASYLFTCISRIIRGQDLSISSFMLPYVVLNVVVGGEEEDVMDIVREVSCVLEIDLRELNHTMVETVKMCSEDIFRVLDYLSRWGLERRKTLAVGVGSKDSGQENSIQQGRKQLENLEKVLLSIPAEVISTRAMQCGSFARALFYWERYQRESLLAGKEIDDGEYYAQLSKIYREIDDLDCMDGISSHLPWNDPDQELLVHRRANRWSAVQSWYERILIERPDDESVQVNYLNSLRELGKYEGVLTNAEKFAKGKQVNECSSVLSFAAEAAWVTGNWCKLEELGKRYSYLDDDTPFNVGIAQALTAVKQANVEKSKSIIGYLRAGVSRELNQRTTTSLQTCHEQLLKLHALYEIEVMGNIGRTIVEVDREKMMERLKERLEILGVYTLDKHYLLGIRGAIMELSKVKYEKNDLVGIWVKRASLARKMGVYDAAINFVLSGWRLKRECGIIENSRLLWKLGHTRQAIQTLEWAISKNIFGDNSREITTLSDETSNQNGQNLQQARATLLLARWMDTASCMKSDVVIHKYQQANRYFVRWEKGHYHLGKYYNKQLEWEKRRSVSKQSLAFVSGEHRKLVIESFIRGICFGAKHNYETVPKILTLWLDMASEAEMLKSARGGRKEEYELKYATVTKVNSTIRKYLERVPTFPFYTALAQIISRMGHSDAEVNELLSLIIVKVVSNYPQQALWSLLAVSKSSVASKANQARNIIEILREKRVKRFRNGEIELGVIINMGKNLSEALLKACDTIIDSRSNVVSLSRDLHLNQSSLVPCQLVVPVEQMLMPALPTGIGSRLMKTHEAFPKNTVTIEMFEDKVLVLSSMQRPRKILMRGSDGKLYGILCKPKDDLRKDQRLMEFNQMINRSLKRDVESSKRRLYIKTYAVTPLNEECGAIEWVDGLKTIRDILLKLYKEKGVRIDYSNIRNLLEKSIEKPENIKIFTETLTKEKFPPILYEWFIETFPQPESWFIARLRYTRSCSVMSMVGHILGLGDRHGENVLLEESCGGIFHVDFNCLFDKGLTFEKPELVPFRLTHNMIHAFGLYGVKGPFTIAAEFTIKLLRLNEDSLMTILETFLHDPTVDFVDKKKRKTPNYKVPNTPQEVLENVRMKLQGLFPGESVPLAVEGYVDALISMARDPKNLAAMYIGWCPFL